MLPDCQRLEAAKHNNIEAARAAIARGANVDARDFSGFTPIWLACTLGHMAMAEFLMTQNAGLTLQYGKRRQTLLHWAAEQGSFGMTKFLVARKADVNALRYDNATPLDLATRGDYEYVARLVRDRNAVYTASAKSMSFRLCGLFNGSKYCLPRYRSVDVVCMPRGLGFQSGFD